MNSFLQFEIIIIMMLGIVFLANICNFLSQLTASIEEKRETKIKNIKYTKKLLLFIDTLIMTEIHGTMRNLATLHLRYDIKNFDTDVSRIASAVYNAIKPTYIVSKRCIVTSQYISKYISSSSSITLLEVITEYNRAFDNNK